tara:strand:+ start:154 stop:306 length:153 start_codon:yes stop_codon:yes gene_type:complete
MKTYVEIEKDDALILVLDKDLQKNKHTSVYYNTLGEMVLMGENNTWWVLL